MDTKSRLKILMDEFNLSSKNMAKVFQYKNARSFTNARSKNRVLPDDEVIKLMTLFPNLNLNWFFLGEGPRFIDRENNIDEAFNAYEARKTVDSLYSDELHNILMDIKSKAQQSQNVLHIYKPLKDKTVDALKDKGFDVITYPSIVIQREQLYHSIRW